MSNLAWFSTKISFQLYLGWTPPPEGSDPLNRSENILWCPGSKYVQSFVDPSVIREEHMKPNRDLFDTMYIIINIKLISFIHRVYSIIFYFFFKVWVPLKVQSSGQ